MTTCSTSATVTGNAESVVNRRDVTPGRSRPVSVISRVRFLAFMLLTTLLARDQVSLRCPPSGHPAFASGALRVAERGYHDVGMGPPDVRGGGDHPGGPRARGQRGVGRAERRVTLGRQVSGGDRGCVVAGQIVGDDPTELEQAPRLVDLLGCRAPGEGLGQ